ncbi:MAG: radical SAM protein [Vicinamibacterales bacterium]
MRRQERWEYLGSAPRVAWDAIVRGRYRFTFDTMPMAVCGLSWPARLNLLAAGGNLVHRRLRPWNWPLHMQIELTSFCELECPVCPTGLGALERSASALDPELFEQVLREAGPYLLTLSLWAWGEPLLYKALGRVLEVAGRYPMVTLLSTNGQSLSTPRVQEALREHPPTYLIVAVDGLTDETNSVYRKGARLAPALEGVRSLADWKQRTGARFPVLHCRFMAMRQNEHELPSLRGFATDIGFDMVSLRSLSIIDSAEDAHRNMVPADELLRAYRYERGQRVQRDDFVCQHAFSFPTLLADGTVVACEQDFNGGQPYGVLKKGGSFRDIWLSSRASEVRRTIRDRPGELSFCRNCPYADRPISSCSFDSYAVRPFEV